MFVIDVSKYNGALTVAGLVEAKAAGLGAVIVKVSQGSFEVSPTALNNIVVCRRAGMPIGAYHFFDSSSVHTQADNFLVALHNFGGIGQNDLPPALDWEAPGTEGMKAGVYQWLMTVAKARLRVPMLYGSSDWLASYGGPELSPFLLWIAQYSDGSAPTLPSWAKGSYDIWQGRADGNVPGVGSGVDMDKINPHVTLSDIIAASKDMGRIGL